MKKCPKCGEEHDKPGLFCSRHCANSRVRSNESKIKTANTMKGYHFGSAVLKEKVVKRCPVCDKSFEILKCHSKKIYCSKKCFNDSNGKYRKPSGGKRPGSGRGKKGWYKGYWCDSSWELAYVIYNLEHNIKFERNKEGFEYEFKNKKYKYYPDFILEDGTYIEIKGFKTEQSKTKESNFTHIKFLYEKDLEEVFKYVKNKYGKEFISLYENLEVS